ncbi:uncharacterized protein LOC106065228 isoform X2 [Biomphalaria glabrata]|uniref:Uncharacterized protein LOC106065228 isoform X2 n=1 Tax=Biomphalaria glabrata TaxID=6526 RepID=A0A9W3A8N1_BIOGL|nr:uncharacterized protein LOC106065228 isoform X2 [Biomphalaria glabrata]
MTLAVNCGAQWIREYLTTPPKDAWYDFEREYLMDLPITDLKKASSFVFSTAQLLNASTNFIIGDVVAVLVTIRDGYDQRKHKGGDEITAWFNDIQRDSKMAAKVTDFNNGTYLISSVLPWQGTLRLSIELTYSREFFMALLTSHLLIKAFQQTIAGFANTKANESTPCFNTPVLPGYNASEVCNLTSLNGSPWFCGLPVKKELTCQDYKWTRLLFNNADAPLLPAELSILRDRRYGLIGVKEPILIDVLAPSSSSQDKQMRIVPLIPCHQVPARKTWEQEESAGYFYADIGWVSLQCYPGHDFDAACRKDVETQWADPLNDLIPSNVAIDNIPTTGRYIVVLNHYLHITGQHISAYVDKMITIKNSLLNAFARNPSITVVLQGPHIVTREGSYRGGDMMIRFINRIHMDVFKELRDKVLYYPVLDMTIASRNNDTHPEAYVRREWTRYLFALMCNRLNGSS